MRTMRFSRLCLLSTREGRAFDIDFPKDVTVVRGGNGFGKSGIMKSLYDALGAEPHKIDAAWKSAAVSTLLYFEIDDAPYRALKTGGRYALYEGHTPIIDTNSVSTGLAPAIASLLDFGLLMNDKKDNLIVPPPAYAFAPFYVDQDRGWTKPWDSFARMYLGKSAQALSTYHTGLRTNAYYLALAKRDQQQRRIRELENERAPLLLAINEVAKISEGLALNFDIKSFEDEAEELARRSTGLAKRQGDYREKLNQLTSEKTVWEDQQSILQAALSEMRESVSLAATLPEHVDCPTCGQVYENSITSRFGLVAEYDDIFDALQQGRERIAELTTEVEALRKSIGSIEVQIDQIDEVLSIRTGEVSLGDVISAQGRNETIGILREKVNRLDDLIGQAYSLLKQAENDIKAQTDRARSNKIQDYFDRVRNKFAEDLDVRLQHSQNSITAPKLARGSEGPRELLTYYFAVLFCAREFSSSAFCPIVIDAPNQQGQDRDHLRRILKFLVENRPSGTQLIFAAEEPEIEASDEVDVITIEGQKNRLLEEDRYDEVFEEMRPYLDVFL